MGSPLPPGLVSPDFTFPPPYSVSPPPAAGPYTVAYGSIAAPAASLTQTVIKSVGQGDAIHISALSNSPSTAAISVTDSQNNVYQMATNDTNRSPNLVTFVALDCNPLIQSVDTITVTYAGTATIKAMIARGCPGIASFMAIDQPITTDGTGTSPSISTPALGSNGEWAIASISNAIAGGTPSGWGGGFNPVTTVGPGPFLTIADQVVSSTSALTASSTIGSGSWVMSIVTLSPVPMVNPLSAQPPPSAIPALGWQPLPSPYTVQDTPWSPGVQPIITVQPTPTIPAVTSLVQGHEDASDFNTPESSRVIVNAQPPTVIPGTPPATFRNTLQDPPVLTTAPPIVQSQPTPTILGSTTLTRGQQDPSDFNSKTRIIVSSQPTPTTPAVSIVTQNPQVPPVVTSGPITYPIVTEQPNSASSYTVTPLPELFRNTLQDPPVLTTVPPIVSAQPTPTIPGVSAFSRSPQPPVQPPTVQPLVVTQPTPTIAGSTSISRTPLAPPNPVQPIVVATPTKFPPDSVRILISNPPPYIYVATPDPIVYGVQGISFGPIGQGPGCVSVTHGGQPPPPLHVGGTVAAYDRAANPVGAFDRAINTVGAFDRTAHSVLVADRPANSTGAYDRPANSTGAFDYFP